jgi:hypothetical protein
MQILISVFFRSLRGWGLVGLFKMLFYEFFYTLRFGLSTYKNIAYKESSHNEKDNYNIPTPYIYLNYLQKILINCQDFTFVDIGSGRGRVINFAIRNKFENIVSIEKSRLLTKKLKKKFGNRVIYSELDAGEFTLKNQKKAIFYFFESFDEDFFYEFINRQIINNNFEKVLLVLIHSRKNTHLIKFEKNFVKINQLKFSEQRQLVVLKFEHQNDYR